MKADRQKLLDAIGRARDAEFGSDPADPLTYIERIAKMDRPRPSAGVTERVAYALRVAGACLVVLEKDAAFVKEVAPDA
jgi:hypothetical protein